MSIQLEIPDTIASALRLPLQNQSQQMLEELAVALYARGILPFGKARELARMGKLEFGLLLGRRDAPRHYSSEELSEDVAHAGR